jgi:hypothetical protein
MWLFIPIASNAPLVVKNLCKVSKKVYKILGTSLRNQGHHFLNEKFYCDVHGRQRKAQLGAIQNIGKSFEKVSLADKPPTTTNLDPDLAV